MWRELLKQTMYDLVAQRNWISQIDRDLPPYFTPEEVHRVLDLCEHKRDHLLLNFLWQTGARVSEVIGVHISDIDFYAGNVKMITLKRKKPYYRYVPLNQLKGELADYLLEKGLARNDLIFPITRQRVFEIVQKAVLDAGYDKERAHPHTFRHSFAVNCILQNIPLIVVQKWLGHSSIQSTMVYLKVRAEDTKAFFDEIKF